MRKLAALVLLSGAAATRPLIAQSAATNPTIGVPAPRNVLSIGHSFRSSLQEIFVGYDRRVTRRFTLGLTADVHPSEGIPLYERTRPTGIDRVELVGRYYLVGSAFRGLSLGAQAGEQRVWDDANHRERHTRHTNAVTLDYQSMIGSGRWKFAWSTGIVARNFLHNSPAPNEWGYSQILGLRFSLGVAR
ncbi:MAG TPA: hypothetical protein VHM30_14845 [Gemmatimonadaceae bacterium]|nr:hypothetical protein [Gemmatimonadaceae bacterium]